MRLVYSLLGIFVASVFCLHGQVAELWRSGLTNNLSACPIPACPWSPTNYVATAAGVDAGGGTIVGGYIDRLSNTSAYDLFLAKFDAHGRKAWQYQAASNLFNGIAGDYYSGVESLAVDLHGDTYVATRAWRRPDSIYPDLVCIKVSRDGKELWRIAEGLAPSNYGSVGGVAVAGDGGLFLTGLVPREEGPDQWKWLVFVSKHSADGKRLWQTFLPGNDYALPGRGLGRSVVAMQDGGAVVVGSRAGSGFAARLDSNGTLVWWSDDFKGDTRPPSYSSILIGTRDVICAASRSGATVYSAKGRAMRTDSEFAGDAADVTPDGGFILKHNTALEELAPNGRVRWRLPGSGYGLWLALGVIVEPAETIIAAGPSSYPTSSLGFARLSSEGEELWRVEFPNYPAENESNRNLDGFLRAPDGTFRVILNAGLPFGYHSTGVTVAAFNLAPLSEQH